MTHPSLSPEERFARVVEELLGTPGVTPPEDGPGRKGFGSLALKIHNKIFAMLVRERLVVKLPQRRVDALIAAGEGERFDPKKNGQLMKEWIVIEPASKVEWLALAKEAMEYVASGK
jgi:hypothetical protein